MSAQAPSYDLESPFAIRLASMSDDPLRRQLLALHEPRFRGERPACDEVAWREALTKIWAGRVVAVWGAAITGLAAAQLLAELGAKVTLSDSRALERPSGLHPSVRLITGQPNSLEGAELVIPSPGLKPTHPLLLRAREAGVNVMSEIELAALCTRARLIAVTGTDGKSTTTCLITHMCQGVGLNAWGVGNLGEPISVRALEAGPEDALVCEVSAFQLWSTRCFPAELCVVTNIAEDHLDYFEGDFERYRDAKLRLTQLCAAVGGVTLAPPQLSLDAPRPPDLAPTQALAVRRFAVLSAQETPSEALDLYAQGATLHRLGEAKALAELSCSPLIGRHNQLNICAALLCVDVLDLSLEGALASLPSFRGLPHRMALVRVRAEVRWVNDSKATNVHASLAGLMSVDDRLVIIVGGKEKGLDYTPLWGHLTDRAARGLLSRILLIGELASRLERELSSVGLGELTERCDLLDVAVQRASALEGSAEMVLLSPASSSFDQFKSFEERGERFEALVHALSEPTSPTLA